MQPTPFALFLPACGTRSPHPARPKVAYGVSFWLKPAGFFDRNPALDVAPTPEACDHHHSHHEDSDD